MVSSITSTAKNFVNSFIPQMGQKIRARTHAAVTAGLAILANYEPYTAMQLGATYLAGAYIWNRLPGNQVLLPIAESVVQIGAYDRDAELARQLREEVDNKEEKHFVSPGPLFDNVEDSILLDGSQIPPHYQIAITGQIYDVRNVIKMMLNKPTMQNPIYNGPLDGDAKRTICNALGITLRDFEKIWTDSDAALRESRTQIQYENELTIGARVNQALLANPLQDQAALLVNVTAEVSADGDRRLNEMGETLRAKILLATLGESGSELVHEFDSLFLDLVTG